jgi:hypothetical protein
VRKLYGRIPLNFLNKALNLHFIKYGNYIFMYLNPYLLPAYLIAIIIATIISLFAIQIIYFILLKKLFETIKTEFSIKKPWTVWLSLIPALGSIWFFYLIFKAKTGTEKTLSFYKSQEKSNAGFYWFLASFILSYSSLLSTSSSFQIVVKYQYIFIFGIISSICYIIHIIKLISARKLILKAKQNYSNINELK